MTDPYTPQRVSSAHLDALKRYRKTVAEIADGRLPSLEEIYRGCGFAGDDIKLDIRLWCRDLLLDESIDDLADRIQHLHDVCTVAALQNLRTAVEADDLLHDVVDRIDLYLAANGDRLAHARVVAAIIGPTFGRPDYRRIIFGLAVAKSITALRNPPTHLSAAETMVRSVAADVAMSSEAGRMIDNGGVAPSAEEMLQQRLASVVEDRAEVETQEYAPVIDGRIVVPVLPISTGHKASIAKVWAGVAGRPLTTIKVQDIVEPLKVIEAEMPHAVGLAMRMAMTLQVGSDFYQRPSLFVGGAGLGKTSFARLYAKAFGVPSETHNLAGASDASIGGTSSQYNSARESSFLQQVRREGVANPVAVLDELEKASQARHNGSALDVILPLLEKHTASRYRDPALEVEVDLSGVTILATANSLESIPGPLRDRFTIYQMPEPKWQHVGALSRSILNRIAEERSLDRRWFPDLAGDELEALKSVWSGGSIRRLERAIRLMVDGRDGLLGEGMMVIDLEAYRDARETLRHVLHQVAVHGDTEAICDLADLALDDLDIRLVVRAVAGAGSYRDAASDAFINAIRAGVFDVIV